MKQKHYIAGLYYRLSQEDERQGESVSIDNQRTILRKYAEERGFEIHDEYIDDGVSGTTFQRPEVQRLLDDAKTGVINTIIVKDLSRFGRNYIEVGQYIDYIFPAFGIRFIAIQDNVDTENRDSNAMEMMPIMNIFNEWHAANTSKKIRAVLKSNAKDGNAIRKMQEQQYLEEEKHAFFGLDLSEEVMKKEMQEATNIHLSAQAIAQLVETYLEKRLGADKQYILGEGTLKTLRLNAENRNVLLTDFSALDRQTNPVYKAWENYLTNKTAFEKITFDGEYATEHQDTTFIMPTHPLVKQAINCFADDPVQCNLAVKTTELPVGKYPFIVYEWQYKGVKPIQRMLSNRRYIGEYKFRDTVIPNGIPALVSEELFARVRERLEKNKKAPARHKAEDDYILTLKLFCGKCGAHMFGESGTSKTMKTYYYYKCARAKKGKLCDKKAVRKEWIEDIAIKKALDILENEELVSLLVDRLYILQGEENPRLPRLNEQLADIEKRIGNMLSAIEQGIITDSTKDRLAQLEEKKKEIEITILQEKIKKPFLTKEQILFGIEKYKKLDLSTREGKQRLIDGFINAIYVYDDRITFTYNYKDGTETITLSELESAKSSDIKCVGAPNKKHRFLICAFCFCTSFEAEPGGFARAGNARDAQPRGPLQGFRLIPCRRTNCLLRRPRAARAVRRAALCPARASPLKVPPINRYLFNKKFFIWLLLFTF